MPAKTRSSNREAPDPVGPEHHPLRRLTPVADRGTHVIAAATLWSLVGIGLVSIFGADTDWAWVMVLAAVILGYVKAHFVLFKTGARIVERIERRGDGRCLGGFQSWKNWAMVAGFILLGRALRATPMPDWLLGGIFLAVGVGLLLASVPIWRHWYSGRPRAG